MSGWLVARNRPPFTPYASPGPSGNSVVAEPVVRLDLTEAASNERSAGVCASTAEENSAHTQLNISDRMNWPFGTSYPRRTAPPKVSGSTDTSAGPLFHARVRQRRSPRHTIEAIATHPSLSGG